ncbi:MAG: hypothetical protein WD896_00755 [Parcubacteria group bacterium]
MAETIFSEGNEYISASRGAQKTGYSEDYIGQLCRARKISGQLVGRTWYIDMESLLEHKNSKKYKKKNEGIEVRTNVPKSDRTIFSYSKDELPLFPSLPVTKNRIGEHKTLTSSLLGASGAAIFFLLLAVSFNSFLFQKEFSINASAGLAHLADNLERKFGQEWDQISAIVLGAANRFYRRNDEIIRLEERVRQLELMLNSEGFKE